MRARGTSENNSNSSPALGLGTTSQSVGADNTPEPISFEIGRLTEKPIEVTLNGSTHRFSVPTLEERLLNPRMSTAARPNKILRAASLDEARKMTVSELASYLSTTSVLNMSNNRVTDYSRSTFFPIPKHIDFSGLVGGGHYQLFIGISASSEHGFVVKFEKIGPYKGLPNEAKEVPSLPSAPLSSEPSSEVGKGQPEIEAGSVMNSTANTMMRINSQPVPSSQLPKPLAPVLSAAPSIQRIEDEKANVPSVSDSKEHAERVARQSSIFKRSLLFSGAMTFTELSFNLALGDYWSIPRRCVSTFVLNTVAGLWINNLSDAKSAMSGFYLVTELLKLNPVIALEKGFLSLILPDVIEDLLAKYEDGPAASWSLKR